MKHVPEFNSFLVDEVNLDKKRIQTLISRVEAINRFLSGCGWEARIQRYSPQGSWAHKTIIKPPREHGFDADLLVFVDPVWDWSARDYIDELRETFESSSEYEGRLCTDPAPNRCVTLEYPGDFEIDVVPCVVNRQGGSYPYEICNSRANTFEATDSEAYTRWFEERNSWAGSDKLREVTRLIKYLRDIKGTFSCKSILLTTLLGERLTAADALYQPSFFPDLATALRTLMDRLDDYLQARPQLHVISNPVLPQERFTRHWDPEKYATFREMIHTYRMWIDDAYSEADQSRSVVKWRRVFGDEFARGSLAVQQIAQGAVASINALPAGQDAVSVVRQYGVQALQAVRSDFPWVRPPQWRLASQKVPVVVKATAHKQKTDESLITGFDTGRPLSKGLYLKFEAVRPDGLPYHNASIRKDYTVRWQVANTDSMAWQANELRGDFYDSQPAGMRWEHTKFRGVHWVEAFVIRKRDRACVGRSGRFFVVIE